MRWFARRTASRLLLLFAVPALCLSAPSCVDHDNDPDPAPGGDDFLTTSRLIMTSGGKKTLCTYWRWNGFHRNADGNQSGVYEVFAQWTVPPGDPHKCLGGAAKAAAIVRGGFSSRMLFPTGADSSSRDATSLPTQAFFAGGVGPTTHDFASDQAYFYDAPSNSWRGFSMTAPRTGHTVTALNDGRVLVAGGWDGGNSLDSLFSCDLFDPVALSLAPTGSLQTRRQNHAASLLPDGRVLVTGGSEGTGYLDSAEIYDPSTGQFTPAASMAHLRSNHCSTTLDDGRVLITGGNGVKEAEVFDANTGQFSAVGSMNDDHGYGASATKLDSGQVLILGGLDSGAGFSTASAELFDPATNQFTKISNMNVARKLHSANLQADGTVFIAGGITDNGDTVASTEIFNPADNSFTPSIDLPLPASEQAGVVLSIE